MPKGLSIAGQKFNMLTVLEKSEMQINGNVKWDCVCDCGTLCSVTGSRLKQGITKSCGCLAKFNAIGNVAKTTHNMSKTSEYQAWSDAKLRCFNTEHPQYGYYGGRGITMQESWVNNFQSFIGFIGVKPYEACSLDRIDNDSDYCEGNVRWATKSEQAANRGKNVNNKTGVTGVVRSVNTDNGYVHYKAFWGAKTSKHCVSFSVNKYGEQNAFNMAVKARMYALENLRLNSVYTEKHGEDRQSK